MVSILEYSWSVYGFMFTYPDAEPTLQVLEDVGSLRNWTFAFSLLFNLVFLNSISNLLLDRALRARLMREVSFFYLVHYFIILEGTFFVFKFPLWLFYSGSSHEFYFQAKQ